MSFLAIIRKAMTDTKYLEDELSPASKKKIGYVKKRRYSLTHKKTSSGQHFSDRPARFKKTHSGHH